MYRGGHLRDISEDSEVGVTIIQQFRHLGPFTHPLSSSPSVDHGLSSFKLWYSKGPGNKHKESASYTKINCIKLCTHLQFFATDNQNTQPLPFQWFFQKRHSQLRLR